MMKEQSCTLVQDTVAQGAILSMGFHHFGKDEFHSVQTGGEEVIAIKDGIFDIEAAGEQYRLQRGEAILIPSGEPRKVTCVSDNGTLYRVSTPLEQTA